MQAISNVCWRWVGSLVMVFSYLVGALRMMTRKVAYVLAAYSSRLIMW